MDVYVGRESTEKNFGHLKDIQILSNDFFMMFFFSAIRVLMW